MMMAIERLAASQGSRRNLPHPLSRSQVSSSTTDVSLPLAPVNLSGQHKTAVKQFEPTSSPLSTAQSPVSQSIKVPSPPQSVSSFTSSQLEKLTGYTHTDFYFDAIASGFYPPPGKIPKANIPATKHVPSHNMDTRSSSSKSLLASGSKSVHGSARKSSELTEEEVAEILRELDVCCLEVHEFDLLTRFCRKRFRKGKLLTRTIKMRLKRNRKSENLTRL